MVNISANVFPVISFRGKQLVNAPGATGTLCSALHAAHLPTQPNTKRLRSAEPKIDLNIHKMYARTVLYENTISSETNHMAQPFPTAC
jgi:hypothetical protein